MVYALLKAVHVLAVVLWVGGMAFAHFFLRPALATLAVEQAARLAASMDYVGVLCVEFFVLDDASLVANEMAPRPHNSGHYSIDACDLSQFDLQARCMAGLPLVTPRIAIEALPRAPGDWKPAMFGTVLIRSAALCTPCDPATRPPFPSRASPA